MKSRLTCLSLALAIAAGTFGLSVPSASADTVRVGRNVVIVKEKDRHDHRRWERRHERRAERWERRKARERMERRHHSRDERRHHRDRPMTVIRIN